VAAGLTERELEVLLVLVRGDSNREIGERLGISGTTVGHDGQHVYVPEEALVQGRLVGVELRGPRICLLGALWRKKTCVPKATCSAFRPRTKVDADGNAASWPVPVDRVVLGVDVYPLRTRSCSNAQSVAATRLRTPAFLS
jgi:hypothetical protein